MRLIIDLSKPDALEVVDGSMGFCPHCNVRSLSQLGDVVTCERGHKYPQADCLRFQRFYCPHDGCDAPKTLTERRMNGDSHCANGHKHPTKEFKAFVRPFPIENSMGFCPQCNDHSHMREKSINGNDVCVNGHKFPSKSARKTPWGGCCIPANPL